MQHNQAVKKKYTNPKSLMALSSDQSSITNEEQEASINLEFENFHPLTPHISMISLPQYPEPMPFISILEESSLSGHQRNYNSQI